eukprot:COSAG02_NODE_46868_length_345_cov_1.036585_1_plen_104_part_00
MTRRALAPPASSTYVRSNDQSMHTLPAVIPLHSARSLFKRRSLSINRCTYAFWRQTAAELGTLEGQTPQRVYDSGFEATQHVLASAAQSGTVRDKTNKPGYSR